MLCFSSSRWPLVVSRGTLGALPGPLWLWLRAGTGVMVLVGGFVIDFSLRPGRNAGPAAPVPRPTGKSLPIYGNPVKPQNKKYFAFPEMQIRTIFTAIPSHSEGRRPSSRRGAGCDGRGGCD